MNSLKYGYNKKKMNNLDKKYIDYFINRIPLSQDFHILRTMKKIIEENYEINRTWLPWCNPCILITKKTKI